VSRSGATLTQHATRGSSREQAATAPSDNLVKYKQRPAGKPQPKRRPFDRPADGGELFARATNPSNPLLCVNSAAGGQRPRSEHVFVAANQRARLHPNDVDHPCKNGLSGEMPSWRPDTRNHVNRLMASAKRCLIRTRIILRKGKSGTALGVKGANGLRRSVTKPHRCPQR
jgi:hypothetical protein